MPTFKLRQKISLILLGFVVTCILLESGLRLAGFFYLSAIEQGNQRSFKQNKEYRILCLGESATALGGRDSYPRQLEDILNDNRQGIRFSVINKGIPSVTTTYILEVLKKFLDQYHPQIVVTMMGINDGPNLARPENKTVIYGNHFLHHFVFVRAFLILSMAASSLASGTVSEMRK